MAGSYHPSSPLFNRADGPEIGQLAADKPTVRAQGGHWSLAPAWTFLPGWMSRHPSLQNQNSRQGGDEICHNYPVKTPVWGKALLSSLTFEPFVDLFWLSTFFFFLSYSQPGPSFFYNLFVQ